MSIAVFISLATDASMVNAQSAFRFKVDIPFQFVVNGHTLPAGRYVVERSDPTRPNMLALRNKEARIVKLLLTHRVERTSAHDESCLMFLQWEGEFYLFQIWTVGALNGNQIPMAAEVRAGNNSQPALVKLRVEDR